mgnify:CR=1 FL=1
MPLSGQIKGHRIVFRQLSFPVSIGVLPHEREGPQQVTIDLEIELRPDMPDPQEDLAKVQFSHPIRPRSVDIAQSRHLKLLHSLRRESSVLSED